MPDGYVAIFSTANDPAYTLPPLGALAWEYLDGDHSTEDFVREIAAVVGSENTTELPKQITELVHELERSGFLQEC